MNIDNKEKEPHKIGHRIFNIILNILIIIVTILTMIGFYYVFQIQILKKEYANLFGYTFFEVSTGSMAPTIQVGDVVVVKITKEIEENEIIVFRQQNYFVTHRLIQKNGEQIITKGDANNTEDKAIQIDDVLGKVIKIVPQVGIWKRILLSPEVFGLVVILVIFASVLYIYTSKSEEKKEWLSKKEDYI